MKNFLKCSFFLAFVASLGILTLSSCGKDSIEMPELAICDSTLFVTIALEADGVTLTANGENGTAPYAYEWSTSATTPSIETDGTGTYSVTLTDDDGCQTNGEYTFSPTTIPCDSTLYVWIGVDSVNTTTLIANADGGTRPYAYEWSDGSTTQSIDTDGNGTYAVTLTDAYGCSYWNDYEFPAQSNPCDSFVVNIQVYTDSLQVGTTTLRAVNNGGNNPFAYNWSTGEDTHEINTTATSGEFSVTVTDDEGCTAADTTQL